MSRPFYDEKATARIRERIAKACAWSPVRERRLAQAVDALNRVNDLIPDEEVCALAFVIETLLDLTERRSQR